MFNRQVFSTLKASLDNASRRRGAALGVALLALGGLPAFAIPASAGDALKPAGASLSPVSATGGVSDVRRKVDLAGDVPTATYVSARSFSGALFVRTRDGYWLPWTGREADLIDNGLTPVGGSLEFKILKEQLPASYLPVTVTIAYRTVSGIKFGSFEITAP